MSSAKEKSETTKLGAPVSPVSPFANSATHLPNLDFIHCVVVAVGAVSDIARWSGDAQSSCLDAVFITVQIGVERAKPSSMSPSIVSIPSQISA